MVLESVLESDYSDLEVIVVDDCSSDDTSELLHEHYAGRVNIIRNKRESLLAFSRNAGLRYATGEYILALDSDCLVNEDTIKGLVGVLEKDENIGCATPTVTYISGKVMHQGARLFPFFLPIRSQADRTLVKCDFTPGSIGLFRSHVLGKVGGWNHLDFPLQAEDADLCLRIREAGYSTVCATWIRATHLSTRLIRIENPLRAREAAKGRLLLCKRHLTKTKFLIYISLVNQFIVAYYLLYFLANRRPSLFKHYLRGLIDAIND